MNSKERLINELRGLYNQNLDFIDSIANGTSQKKYSKKTVEAFKKLNTQLKEYIEDIENFLTCDKTLQDWCELFGDTLLDDCCLDDDNFPIGGKW